MASSEPEQAPGGAGGPSSSDEAPPPPPAEAQQQASADQEASSLRKASNDQQPGAGEVEQGPSAEAPRPAQAGRCQVPGCTQDLPEKDAKYYKRFRICRLHSSLKEVRLDGIIQRFCQQCGRFQELGDFDADRKSCRASLEKHNARRKRKLAAQQPAQPPPAVRQHLGAMAPGLGGMPYPGGPMPPPQQQQMQQLQAAQLLSQGLPAPVQQLPGGLGGLLPGQQAPGGLTPALAAAAALQQQQRQAAWQQQQQQQPQSQPWQQQQPQSQPWQQQQSAWQQPQQTQRPAPQLSEKELGLDFLLSYNGNGGNNGGGGSNLPLPGATPGGPQGLAHEHGPPAALGPAQRLLLQQRQRLLEQQAALEHRQHRAETDYQQQVPLRPRHPPFLGAAPSLGSQGSLPELPPPRQPPADGWVLQASTAAAPPAPALYGQGQRQVGMPLPLPCSAPLRQPPAAAAQLPWQPGQQPAPAQQAWQPAAAQQAGAGRPLSPMSAALAAASRGGQWPLPPQLRPAMSLPAGRQQPPPQPAATVISAPAGNGNNAWSAAWGTPPTPSQPQLPYSQEDLERIAVQLFQVPASELAPHVREGVISMMMEDPTFAERVAPRGLSSDLRCSSIGASLRSVDGPPGVWPSSVPGVAVACGSGESEALTKLEVPTA